jgi:glutathione S-transferase
MSERLILHEYALSGNCYKVRLTAAHLGIPLERREYDIQTGETRTPEFLANVNSNGRIPVLQVGNRFIPESNAACFYLGDGSDLVPADRFGRADMLRWMFFEQYSHEPNIATVRFWLCVVGLDALSGHQREQIGLKRKAGNDALALMDEHLARHTSTSNSIPTSSRGWSASCFCQGTCLWMRETLPRWPCKRKSLANAGRSVRGGPIHF